MFLGLPDIANDPELIPSWTTWSRSSPCRGRTWRRSPKWIGGRSSRACKAALRSRCRTKCEIFPRMRRSLNGEFLVATEAGGKQVKAPGAIAKFESGTWRLCADAPSKIEVAAALSNPKL